MKFAFLLLTPLFLLMLASCGQGTSSHVPLVATTEIVLPGTPSQNEEITHLSIEIEIENHRLALHEPAAGAFIGAYIERDSSLDGIRAFETETNVSHAIFAYTMALDDDYPILWVLKNIALMKSPFISVLPPSEGPVYNLELIKDLAVNAGRFNVPIFINLFPLEANHIFTSEEYIHFFRQSRTIFSEHAPNAALVWGFDAEEIIGAMQFYPGAFAVDWIHMTVYNDVDVYGRFNDFFAHINLFYFAFQREAPLMVSTAVSHYTLENNSYFVREAAEKIDYIYSGLQAYPRIKAVIYRSYNDTFGRGNKYAISSMPAIIDTYAAVTASPHFLKSSDGMEEEYATKRILSPFRAVMRNSDFYIPIRALLYDAGIPYHQIDTGVQTEISGEMFMSIADVNRIFGMDFFVDMQRHLLVLR